MPPSARLVALVLSLLASVVGCDRAPSTHASRATDSTTSRSPIIYTTFYPTCFFASRIVGDRATVVCPLPDGEDPIFWSPPTDILQAFQSADLIVINGANFEQWVSSAALPMSRLVDASAPLHEHLITIESTTHRHGTMGEHSHEGLDGHTWMAPANAIEQARAILLALQRRWPEHANAWHHGHRQLEEDLLALDRRFRELAPLCSSAVLIASHPAYNYIAQRYAITIHTIPLSPDQPPDPDAQANLSNLLRNHPHASPRILLWEDDPADSIREHLENDFAIRSLTFSPCESLSQQDRALGNDYLVVMNRNLDRLFSTLRDAR